MTLEQIYLDLQYRGPKLLKERGKVDMIVRWTDMNADRVAQPPRRLGLPAGINTPIIFSLPNAKSFEHSSTCDVPELRIISTFDPWARGHGSPCYLVVSSVHACAASIPLYDQSARYRG